MRYWIRYAKDNRLWWNGERWVLNVKHARTYAKTPATKLARRIGGLLVEVWPMETPDGTTGEAS